MVLEKNGFTGSVLKLRGHRWLLRVMLPSQALGSQHCSVWRFPVNSETTVWMVLVLNCLRFIYPISALLLKWTIPTGNHGVYLYVTSILLLPIFKDNYGRCNDVISQIKRHCIKTHAYGGLAKETVLPVCVPFLSPSTQTWAPKLPLLVWNASALYGVLFIVVWTFSAHVCHCWNNSPLSYRLLPRSRTADSLM